MENSLQCWGGGSLNTFERPAPSCSGMPKTCYLLTQGAGTGRARAEAVGHRTAVKLAPGGLKPRPRGAEVFASRGSDFHRPGGCPKPFVFEHPLEPCPK